MQHAPAIQDHAWLAMASLVDRAKVMLIPLVMLMMPVFRAAPPLMRWRTRRKIYRWYSDLRASDQRLIAGISAAKLEQKLAQLGQIEYQMAQIDVPQLHEGVLSFEAAPGDDAAAPARIESGTRLDGDEGKSVITRWRTLR